MLPSAMAPVFPFIRLRGHHEGNERGCLCSFARIPNKVLFRAPGSKTEKSATWVQHQLRAGAMVIENDGAGLAS